MLVLGESEVSDVLAPSEVIVAVERALRDLESRSVRALPRDHLGWDGNSMLTMPALGAVNVGVKVISVMPGNASRGLPVTSGLMILNERNTGVGRALISAGGLTAQRTAAVAAVGVKHTTPATLRSVGIGVQGAWQAVYASGE
jgi:ornithine cyclodeaminase/alanine dehydrogenase-like protein (mu-crystallin family)